MHLHALSFNWYEIIHCIAGFRPSAQSSQSLSDKTDNDYAFLRWDILYTYNHFNTDKYKLILLLSFTQTILLHLYMEFKLVLVLAVSVLYAT